MKTGKVLVLGMGIGAVAMLGSFLCLQRLSKRMREEGLEDCECDDCEYGPCKDTTFCARCEDIDDEVCNCSCGGGECDCGKGKHVCHCGTGSCSEAGCKGGCKGGCSCHSDIVVEDMPSTKEEWDKKEKEAAERLNEDSIETLESWVEDMTAEIDKPNDLISSSKTITEGYESQRNK